MSGQKHGNILNLLSSKGEFLGMLYIYCSIYEPSEGIFMKFSVKNAEEGAEFDKSDPFLTLEKN